MNVSRKVVLFCKWSKSFVSCLLCVSICSSKDSLSPRRC